MSDKLLKLDIPSKDRSLYEKEYKSFESLNNDYVGTYEGLGSLGEAVNGVHQVELKSKTFDGTLGDLVRDGKFPFDFCTFVVQLCSALDHLHNKNIIHGFLTVDNIVVSKNPTPTLKLTHFGFLKWRQAGNATNIDDMQNLKRICIFVATRGKYNSDSPLMPQDLVEVDEKSRPLALNFIQSLDYVTTLKFPSVAILYHPYLLLHNDQLRKRLKELTLYDEMCEPFTVEELKKFGRELEGEPIKEDFGRLEEIVANFTRDTSKFYNFVEQGRKDCPNLFVRFIWRSVAYLIEQPKIVLESPGSLSFSNAIKGTWYRGPEVKRIALKRGKWGTDSEPAAFKKKRFLDELDKLRKIDYMFIVEFLGCVTRDSLRHIVMELCDGNLRMYCHKLIDNMNRGSIDEKVILGQLITGIGYLHSQNIVHGDIRPDSVLLWRHPRGIIIVKITNFGLSKPQPLDTSQYSTTTPLGTKGYIAPEILEVGDPEKVTKTFASDIWALGVLVFFTVSRGEHPFSYRNPLEPNNCLEEMLRKTKMLRNFSKISEYWDSADLIYQMMNPVPEKRPNIYTILLHPLFTMSNETTKNYFAYQMSRLDLVASINSESVSQWYHEFYHNEFKSLSDSVNYQSLVQKLKTDESEAELMEVDEESDVADLNAGQSRIVELMKHSPKLFPIYLWRLMISKNASLKQCREWFFLTPMNYSMIYMSSRFFNQMWTINGAEKNQAEIAKLANLSAALCRPVVSMVVLNGIRSIKDVAHDGTTPLHMACRRRTDATELVRYLLAKGADPDAKDSRGLTPVQYAQKNRHQPGLWDVLLKP